MHPAARLFPPRRVGRKIKDAPTPIGFNVFFHRQLRSRFMRVYHWTISHEVRPMKASNRSVHRRLALPLLVGLAAAASVGAQTTTPTVNDPDLAVRTVASGLTQPIAMAFLGPNSFLVTEKSTGRVKYVVNGSVRRIALDLPVNFASERGLLGIELHPDFRRNHWVYVFWTQSSTGADTDVPAEVGNARSPKTTSPMGNRVDRFIWDPKTLRLRFDRNIIVLRAYQADAGQPERGNHNGGVIRFARGDHGDRPESKDGRSRDEREQLFIIVGDTGRRGVLQNLMDGPIGPGIDDDQFGGPEPDNAHLTGVVLRLNDDGSTPQDNPFHEFGASVGGQAGANLQKVFAYGIRNSFGLAVDPWTGELWESENCDDAFEEINRIEAGHNGGWIQVMGPLARVTEFKAIETAPEFLGLQQLRWPPDNIADSPVLARSRMVNLPGSHYGEPQFSWKYALPTAAIGFMENRSLGRKYLGDLFVGAATPATSGGHIFRFELTPNRQRIAWSDPVLADQVADNAAKHSIVESESLQFGSGFGVGTDIRTGPAGGLFVVSVSTGNVYEIHRASPDAD
jgi:aldose sugar dehydrogenase